MNFSLDSLQPFLCTMITVKGKFQFLTSKVAKYGDDFGFNMDSLQ